VKRWIALVVLAGCSSHQEQQAPSDDAPQKTRQEEARQDAAQPPEQPASKSPRKAPSGPKLPASPEDLLVSGGPAKLQKALADRGYLDEPLSGKLDDRTSSAVKTFQGDHQLAQTGVPDRETLITLGLDPEKLIQR
jgi:peptidoglycan hydrolase-like protein with peptidoglycan-binding domain